MYEMQRQSGFDCRKNDKKASVNMISLMENSNIFNRKAKVNYLYFAINKVEVSEKKLYTVMLYVKNIATLNIK